MTIWNNSDKSSNLSVTGGGLRVTHQPGNYSFGAVRGNASKTSGKFYYEALIAAAGNVGVGFANASAALSSYIGGDANGSAYFNSGFVSYNGNAAYYATFSAGDVIGIAIDADADKIWYSKNGVWNGNPTTNTGGISVSGIGNFFPVVCSQYPEDDTTANFGGSDFIYSPPSGFSPFDGASSVGISPASTSQGHTASSPVLAAGGSVAPNDAAHATTSTSPTVGVPVAISPDSAISAQTASEPTIAAASSVSVDETAHGHSASIPSLTAQSSVQPDDAEQDHTASEPSLSVSSTVAPDDAHHDSSGSIPTISSGGEVQPDDAAHDHEASSPTLSGALAITPVSAAHAHIAGQPTIAWRSMIAANDAAHDMASSSPVIASRANIYPAPANDAHISTRPVLSAASSINVNSTYHAHRASSSSIRITMLSSSIRTIVTTMQNRTANDSRGSRSVSYDVHNRIETTAVNSRAAVSVRSAQ